jgi:hypothetical protein
VEDSVALALALAAGLGDEWAAIVGLPEANIDALTAMSHPTGRQATHLPDHRHDHRDPTGLGGRTDPPRALLVDDPGPRWADVIAALTEACMLILARPPERHSPQVARRLGALARRNGCALVIAGPWQGADLRLRVERGYWTGLGAGHGHLRGRRALVTTSGRGAAGAGLRAWLWLPAPDGSVTAAEDISAAPSQTLTAAG